MATKTTRVDTPAPVSDPPVELPAIEVEDRDGVCPECGHESFDDESPSDKWLRTLPRRVLHLRPAPARCQSKESDGTEWGPIDCSCRNAFHGS